MNLRTLETLCNENQEDKPTELTKPSCAAEDLLFRGITKTWFTQDCASRKLPTVVMTNLIEDQHYFYPTTATVYRGSAVRDAYVNVDGLVKVAFSCEGRQPGNYNPFQFDPRPLAKYNACYHRLNDDQQEHIYIARVDIGHVGFAPPQDQVDKFDTLLQSMPVWDETRMLSLDFMPIGAKEAAISFANYWNLVGVTCFSGGVSVGALLVAISQVPNSIISINARNLAGVLDGGMKPPFVWLNRKWWKDTRMWGCTDESENRPKKIKIVGAEKLNFECESKIKSDNSPAAATAMIDHAIDVSEPTEIKKISSSKKKNKTGEFKSYKSLRRFPEASTFPGWIEKSNKLTVDQVIERLKKHFCHPTKFSIMSRPAWAKNLSEEFGVPVTKFDVEAIAAEFGLVNQKDKKIFDLCVPVGWWFCEKPKPVEEKSSSRFCI